MFLLERDQIREDSEEPDLVFLYMHEAPPKTEKRIYQNPGLKTDRESADRTETGASVESKVNQTFDGQISVKRRESANPRIAKSVVFPHFRGSVRYPKSSILTQETVSVRGRKVNKDEVINLKKVFDRMDTKKTGKLSYDEFYEAFAKTPALKSAANSIFKNYDVHNTGTITFDEMLTRTYRGANQMDIAVMSKWAQGNLYPDWEQERYMKVHPRRRTIARRATRKVTVRTAGEYKRLFDLYDKNKDGELDLEELKAGLGGVFPSQEIEQMLRELDSNHDDKITLFEFMKLMAPSNSKVPPEVFNALSSS